MVPDLPRSEDRRLIFLTAGFEQVASLRCSLVKISPLTRSAKVGVATLCCNTALGIRSPRPTQLGSAKRKATRQAVEHRFRMNRIFVVEGTFMVIVESLGRIAQVEGGCRGVTLQGS